MSQRRASKVVPIQGPKEVKRKEIPDVPELDAADMEGLLEQQLHGMVPLVGELQQAVPQMAAGDLVAVLERRGRMRYQLGYLHGVAMATVVQLRRSRLITVERYRAAVERISKVAGIPTQ